MKLCLRTFTPVPARAAAACIALSAAPNTTEDGELLLHGRTELDALKSQ